MLMNLSEAPKARSRSERHLRLLSREIGISKKVKEDLKRTNGFKVFRKYTPTGREYTPETTNDFTGVYLYFGVSEGCTCINMVAKQTAPLYDGWFNYDPASFEYWDNFGLADNASQVIEFYNKRKAEGYYPGNHVILLRPMKGFRWHKWGQYIGNYTPCHEYFDDEEGINFVYSYEICKVV